jgi:hypothetical protein
VAVAAAHINPDLFMAHTYLPFYYESMYINALACVCVCMPNAKSTNFLLPGTAIFLRHKTIFSLEKFLHSTFFFFSFFSGGVGSRYFSQYM